MFFLISDQPLFSSQSEPLVVVGLNHQKVVALNHRKPFPPPKKIFFFGGWWLVVEITEGLSVVEILRRDFWCLVVETWSLSFRWILVYKKLLKLFFLISETNDFSVVECNHFSVFETNHFLVVEIWWFRP